MEAKLCRKIDYLAFIMTTFIMTRSPKSGNRCGAGIIEERKQWETVALALSKSGNNDISCLVWGPKIKSNLYRIRSDSDRSLLQV